MSQTQLTAIREYTDLFLLLEKELQQVEEAQLTWKSSDKDWSIAEVLGHLADASIVHYYRVRKLVAEPNYTGWALYDQDEWVARSRVNTVPSAESLSLFREVAHYNGLFYSRLTEEDWAKSGTNDKGETISILKLFGSFINHTHIHLRQIERIKGAFRDLNPSKTIH